QAEDGLTLSWRVCGSTKSEHGAIRFLFGRSFCRSHHHHGARTEASPRTGHLWFTSAALADCNEPCGELPLHRNCLAESPPPAEVLPGCEPAPHLDKFRTPVHGVAGSFLNSVDRGFEIGNGSCIRIRGGLCTCKCRVYTIRVARISLGA